MAEFLQFVIESIVNFFDFLFGIVADYFCWWGFFISDPVAFFNDWIIDLFSPVFNAFPESSVTIGGLMNDLTASNPLAGAILAEVLTGILGLLGIVVIVKAIKLLPFI
jgi:hypothetical protein